MRFRVFFLYSNILIFLDCESPLFLQEIVENRASRDERAREKWGEDKKVRGGGGGG